MKIQKIIWDESYSVGSKILDQQHQNLLNLCNNLGEIAKQKSEEATTKFGDILQELSIYALEHFKTEESILAKHEYEQIKEQENDHYAYQDELIGYLSKAAEGNLDKIGLHHFISNWWVNHILIKDMKFKKLMLKKLQK